MNYLRLSLAAGALTLALALPAFAGFMDTPVTSPTPTPAAGEMHTPAATEIALNLVQGLLALF